MTIPGMSVGGRGFTNFLSNSTMNNLFKSYYKAGDNIEYKEHIQKNGTVMSKELKSVTNQRVKGEQWWSNK